MPVRAVDVANIADTGGMVAAGKHIAKVTSGIEKGGKSEPLVWHLTFTTDAGDVKERIYWTPKAMFRGKLVCEALGVDLSDAKTEIDAADLIGMVCEIQVIHESFEGDDGKQHSNAKIAIRGFAPVGDDVRARHASEPAAKTTTNLFG